MCGRVWNLKPGLTVSSPTGDPRDIVHDWPDALNSTSEALMAVIQKAEAAGKKTRSDYEYDLKWHMKNLARSRFFERYPASGLLMSLNGADDLERCVHITLFRLGMHEMND